MVARSAPLWATNVISNRTLSRFARMQGSVRARQRQRDPSTVSAYGGSIHVVEEPRIVGGNVALDLINTVAPRPAIAEATDWLDSPAALLRWARRVGLVTDAEAEAVSSAWAAEPAAAVQAWHSAVD